MRPGAESEPETPFKHESFRPNCKLVKDPRILDSHFVRFLRRSGLDDLPEIVFEVAGGTKTLLGVKSYTKYELEGTRILHTLRNNSGLNLEPEVIGLLDSYPQKVRVYEPKAAVFTPLSAFDRGVSHTTRMFSDICYWENASPVVDFRLFVGGVLRRIVKGVNAG